MTASETLTLADAPLVVGDGTAEALAAAAAHLRATAANRRATRDIRPDRVARVFFYCAFARAVRRRFRPDSPVAEITRTVLNAGRRHAPVVLPVLEAEMLVRDALGEAVPVQDIPAAAVLTAHVLVFASLVDELALTDDELDALIAAASEQAADLVASASVP